MAVKKKAKKKTTATKNPLAMLKANLADTKVKSAAVKAETKEVIKRTDALLKTLQVSSAPAAKKPAA